MMIATGTRSVPAALFKRGSEAQLATHGYGACRFRRKPFWCSGPSGRAAGRANQDLTT